MTSFYDPNSLIKLPYIIKGIPPEYSKESGKLLNNPVGPLLTVGKTTLMEMIEKKEFPPPDVERARDKFWRYSTIVKALEALGKKDSQNDS
jgi:hypothetical protein